MVANFGAAVALQDSAGNLHRAVPLSKLPHLVAGDRIICEGSTESDLRITQLHTRSSVLEKPDRRNKLKAVAANLTQLAIVSAVIPDIDLLLIDQFCIVAERANIDAIIVLNKSDLADPEQLEILNKHLAVYSSIGYPTAVISTINADGMQPLLNLLSNNTSVLVGQSGVGKSSIVQYLLPDLEVRVGAISAATGIGSHTTTASFRYDLPGNGALIDSPGVRHFAVDHLQRDQVASGYREIFAAAADCKFANCSHQKEPSCNVKDAVENNTIARSRYDNYIRLINTA